MKLLLFAGPSGGHLFPALGFAAHTRKSRPSAQIAVVTTARVSAFLKSSALAADAEIFFLPEFPFPGNLLLKGPSFLLKLAQAFSKTSQLIRDFRPDAVVAFGSFVGFPGVILAKLKNIPTVLHEQNVVIGKANRMLIPFADKIGVSFSATLDRLPGGKGIFVGNILRPQMSETAAAPRKPHAKFQILLLGGSQGSSALNRCFFSVFRLLRPEEKYNLAVIHITGVQDFHGLEHAYDELGVENEVFPFTDEMDQFYASSDLVIARAGAGTLAELALFGLPSILIPYPHAGSHQVVNAKYAAERGAARVLEESELTPERLKAEILSLVRDAGSRRQMAEAARKMAVTDSGERLVGAVNGLLNSRESGNK
ncbi:MAG: UDP-N-acetylglucosamine--N-acetylmuramyl-(pentapeptide) pyrophosphoryl-undecaprenol N-acetylglucosamine transferase [Candidatus Omnitrophica bacterium]|nr:UDP-N-acetylglucosamine--N-acetylmuramyl-(pentapeptide) pyrophosphoryl-undecaprenol N-acetylglucosamine transferase [Candidatus Omnitrophota bacterium]